LTAARSFTVTVTPVNDAPTIGVVADQVIDEDTATSALPFTIADVDGLAAATVTATSSNATLVPDGNLLLGGGGADRSVTATPAPDRVGSTTITLTVNDGVSAASSWFVLAVTPVNDAPTISAIADQSVAQGTTSIGPLTFTIGDSETSASVLQVSATSSDVSIVPQGGIVLGGTEAARTITLAIPASANGSADVTIAVSDGSDSTPMMFRVTVEGPRGPAAPLDLRAAVQGRRVDLSWRIPAEEGAADHAATGFRIDVGSASGLSNVATFTTGVTTTFTIADLAPGAYFIRVRGVNPAGVGDPSNEVQVMVTGPPGPDAPQRLRATIAGSTVQLDWEAPSDGLAVDRYRVEASYLINATNIGVIDTLAPQLIVPDVGNGIYYARVRGIRANALTAASNEIIVMVGPDSCTAPPPPPSGMTLVAMGNFAAARWVRPASTQPVERYIVSVGSGPGLSDRGAYEFSAATTSVGAFVADGTYVVRVAAANRCGTSVPTAEASITIGGPPPQLPGAPGAVTAAVNGSTVQLDWTAPTTGGAPARYIIEATTTDGAPVLTIDTGNPSTTFTYEGALPGVYVVRVRAANGAGAGAPAVPIVVTVGP
jgi:predicted phage tail protein